MKSLTPQQVDAILTATASHRMHNYIVLSLLTGARTEELRALDWNHVHLEPTLIGDREVPPHVEVWLSVRATGDIKNAPVPPARPDGGPPSPPGDLQRRH